METKAHLTLSGLTVFLTLTLHSQHSEFAEYAEFLNSSETSNTVPTFTYPHFNSHSIKGHEIINNPLDFILDQEYESKSFNLNGVNVSPNPTYGDVLIRLGETYQRVTLSLRNALGETINSETFENVDHINYKVDGESGFYFLEVKRGDQSTVTRILKN